MRWLQSDNPITRAQHSTVPMPHDGTVRLAELRYLSLQGITFAISARTGGWAAVDDHEFSQLRALDGASTRELLARNGTADNLEAIWSRGLVEVGGTLGIDPDQHDAAVEATRKHYSLVLLMNSGCNLACTYCYLGHELPRPANAMSAEVLHHAIDQAVAQPWPELLIDFGEVAAAESAFRSAVSYAEAAAAEAGKALRLSIQTNGTTVDDELADFIAAHGISVGLSVDGTKAMHDATRLFRSGAGSHELALAGLRRLVARRVPVHVPVTIGRHNVGDPTAVLDAIAELGVGSWLFKPILAHGEAATAWDANGVSAKEYGVFMSEAIAVANARNLDLLDTTARKFLWRLFGDSRGWGDSCTSRTCGSGRSLHTVDAKGGVHACPRFVDDPLAHVPPDGTGGLRKALPLIDLLAPTLRTTPTTCAGCPWLHSCGGGCTLGGGHGAEPLPDPHCDAYDEIHRMLLTEVMPDLLAGAHQASRIRRGTSVVDQPLREMVS